jgi:predicted nucleic acid-binding protein
MATTAGNRYFVDTNVLAYALISSAPQNFMAMRLLQRLDDEDAEIWISRQVLRELAVVLSRSSHKDQVTASLRGVATSFCIAEEHELVSEQLFLLLDQFQVSGKNIHDANIVATMLAYDIRHLLTYDTADFRRFAGLIVAADTLPQ